MRQDLLTKVILLAMVLLLAVNLILMVESPAQGTQTRQYRVIDVEKLHTASALESLLNQEVAQGWKLHSLVFGGALILEK